MRHSIAAYGAAALATTAAAAEPARPLVAPLVPCRPAVVFPCPPGSTAPGQPGGMPGTPGSPSTPPGTPPVSDTPDVSGAFARQSEGGTQAAGSFAPSMFGDILGARPFQVTYRANATARLRLVGAARIADGSEAVVVSPTALGRGTITFTTPDSRVTTVDLSSVANGQNLDFVQPVVLPGAIDAAFATQAMESLLSRGPLTPAQQAQFNRLTPDQRAQLLRSRGLLNPAFTRALDGITTPDVRVSELTGTIGGGDALYSFATQSTAQIALPGGGALVGRIKMSEDNSPIPRDRVIFTYDHFDSVPLTTFGSTVNRFQFGVEKTFLDGRWSAEFRLPFAGTLASTSVQGFEVNHTELGNVRLALKRIFSQNQVLTTSSGLAVTLPTAADRTMVSALDGSALYAFRNQSVTVEPFVAALFTPTDRLFGQVWGSVNFDTSGGELTWNRNIFGGTGSARITDPPLMAVDAQVGYWLIQNDVGTLRGLAPFAELHWNHVLDQDAFLSQVNARTSGGGVLVGRVADHELNLSVGFLARVGDSLNLSIGASAPLLQKPDRTFDAQLGVRASYLFGRTARTRSPIGGVNSY